MASAQQRLWLSKERVAVGLGRYKDPKAFAPLTENRAMITWPAPQFDEIIFNKLGAEKILNGCVPLFDDGELQLDWPIRWHRDPINDVEAPGGFWADVPFEDFARCGDYHVIAEINRLQFLVALGRGYRESRDERYTRHFQKVLWSWITANPYGEGINWCSPSEVALRAVALIWCLRLFMYSHELTPESLRAINGLLVLSAQHLEHTAFADGDADHRWIAEALGLFYIGAYFEGLHKQADEWRDRGWKQLLVEATAQTLADGVHGEASVGIHKVVTEAYLLAVRVAHEAGLEVSPEFFQRTQEMVAVARGLKTPGGGWPRVGDDASGRVLALPVNEFMDVGPAEESCAFREAGWYVMRDSGRSNANYMFLRAGAITHCAHADLLSFEAHAKGKAVIVDAGTAAYRPEKWRDYYRGTAIHNTITVDGRDQSEPAGLFGWKRSPVARVNAWQAGDDVDHFDAQHDGYAPLGVTHRRVVWFRKDFCWLVLDLLDGAGEHTLEHRLHLAPCHVAPDDARGLVNVEIDGEGALSLACRASAAMQMTKEDYWFSPRYGTREKSPVLRFAMTAKLPAWFATLLVPWRGGPLQEAKIEFDGSVARLGYLDGADRAITGEHAL